MPANGTSNKLPLRQTFTIEFPVNAPLSTPSGQANFIMFGPQGLVRLNEGILVNSLSGLKMGMVYESPSPFKTMSGPLMESWRIWNIANAALGRDEQIFIPRDVIGEMNDPSFRRIRDSVMLDIVLQLENPASVNESVASVEDFCTEEDEFDEGPALAFHHEDASKSTTGLAAEYKTMLSSLFHQVTSALRDPVATILPQPETPQTYQFLQFPAITPTGMGAAPVGDVPDAPNPNQGPSAEPLIWQSIYFAGDACGGKLPDDAARKHQVIVILRGGCTFQDKLTNIPTFSPSSRSLKLVVIVNHKDGDDEEDVMGSNLFRPLLDKAQVTPSGLLRMHPIPMVFMAGGEEVVELLKRSRSLGLRRRYHIESQGLVVGNIHVI
jgi:hypothetical protein